MTAYAVRQNSGDFVSVNFPSEGNWGYEFYWRLPDKGFLGEVMLFGDGGEDYWMMAINTGTSITFEVHMRQALDLDPDFPGDIAVLSGTVPNNGCWHQTFFDVDLSDSNLATLYLDGEQVDENTSFLPFNFPATGFPTYLWWGAITGTAGMTVDMTHLTVYEGASTTEGVIQAAEHWALFDGCCAKVRPLRQKQRDDYFNAPRNRGASGNSPTSRQASLRSYPGSNTYLKERILEGCGC